MVADMIRVLIDKELVKNFIFKLNVDQYKQIPNAKRTLEDVRCETF